MDFKEILTNAIKRATSPFTAENKNAYEELRKGNKISDVPMRSDRYTYDIPQDNQYDKQWTPTTKEEKKTLTPEGYHRVGDRAKIKDSIKEGIYDAALRKAMKENPDDLLSRNAERAENEANKVFDGEYQEKQISIPSTALNSIKYDPKTGGLYVRFQGEDKDYFYPNVPMEEIEGLMKASSKGEYFMQNIHDQYTMNPGHRPAGQSKVYVNPLTDKAYSAKQVKSFFKKYSKAYEKANKNRMGKLESKIRKGK